MAKGDRLYAKALQLAKCKPARNKLAFQYLKRAAELDNKKAIYAIATWYLFGKYVKKDTKKGVDLLKSSVENGLPEANFDLAIAYEKGEGIEQNLTLAFVNYMIASLKGDENSIYEVGRCFYYGIGIEENRLLGEKIVELFYNMKKK